VPGKNIQLLGVPSSLGANRFGAEGGYRALCAADLHRDIKALGHAIQDWGTMFIPDTKDPGNPKALYMREIAELCGRLSLWVDEVLRDGGFPLVVGGDHSISAGTVSGVASHFRRSNERIGLIWMDAHGDMNTPEVSPSGNVHGMPLAACVGLGAKELVELGGFAPKVNPANTVLVGARDIDPDEAELIMDSGIRCFTIRDIDERGMCAVMHDAIAHATDGTAGFHVTLDMDVMEPLIAPGVGTPVFGGLSYREAHLAFEMIADSERLASLDVVEINPLLDNHNVTAQIAAKLIASALGKRILPNLRRTVPDRGVQPGR